MIKLNFKKNISAFIMLISLVVIAAVFSILSDGIFFYPRNIAMLARQTTIVAIMAIGMMFVIVAGHIDLSVGQMMGFAGTVAAVLQVWYKWDTAPAIIAALFVGILGGVWHGYWVAYRKIPAFIATLGGMLIFQGAKIGLGKSMSIAPMNESFAKLGQAYIPAYIGWIIGSIAVIAMIISVIMNRRSKIKFNFQTVPVGVDIAKTIGITLVIFVAVWYLNRYQGIPMPVMIMLVLALIFSFVAKKTILGRNIFALGGNFEAATLSGIKTKMNTVIVFVISSGLAAAAGIILTARLNAATPAAGDGKELDAIAACVIGGTSMTGGVGSIPAVIVGALVMAALDNGMSLINLETYWQYIVKGLVLTFAVWADTMSKSRSE
ncbi:MAG: sugar ABC transporter permease [Spirochaetales bacterium]|uniref:Xylose transport system permease protein XylH n=1 Tax=Candidatus Thalassospirochaeta sargassi TaxID=3119039 RepID=A0AAJ1IK56_9SPIO|nr:sugar ABC transporter permease [Spirochaetales bacterium]